jgi:hypothetical protein
MYATERPVVEEAKQEEVEGESKKDKWFIY